MKVKALCFQTLQEAQYNQTFKLAVSTLYIKNNNYMKDKERTRVSQGEIIKDIQ